MSSYDLGYSVSSFTLVSSGTASDLTLKTLLLVALTNRCAIFSFSLSGLNLTEESTSQWYSSPI